MDFLDSLDLDTTHKKCHRVRSWYLYEQYKSLERNQLDAAQRLKNKTYQDKILKQEIKDRRVRRTLCDNFNSYRNELQIQKTTQSAPSRPPLSVTVDDLYDSFCELHDAEDKFYNYEDDFSPNSSLTSKHFDECTNVENKNQESDDENVHSKGNLTIDVNIADDVKRELEIVKKDIAENISIQLETVEENIDCFEKFTKRGETDSLTDNDSLDSFVQCQSSGAYAIADNRKFSPSKERFPTWAKFVAFAYEAIQFNHGNFYNSSSSQLMLAVLLCDVVRRGINKMCNILQPYVSPIKYATSDSELSAESFENGKRETSICPNSSSRQNKIPKFCKHSKTSEIKPCRRLRWLLDREYQSENKCSEQSKCTFDNCFNELKYSRESEPWQGVSRRPRGDKSSAKSNSSTSILWPEELSRVKSSDESVCKCRCRSVEAPILQIAQYIESIIKDIED